MASPAFFVVSIVNMVRFLSGNASSWLVDTMNAIGVSFHMTRTLEEPDSTLGGVILYYFYGVVAVLVSVSAVMLGGAALARIIEVGWTQFRQEEKEAAEAAEMMALIADRARRRQKRLARSASKARQGADSDILLITAAIALFAWFL